MNNEFKSLGELYSFLDEDSSAEYRYDLPSKIKDLGERLESNEDMKGCQNEEKIQSLKIQRNDVYQVIYPLGKQLVDLKKLDLDKEYLTKRAEQAVGLKYRIHYNHLLFKLTKDRRIAEKTIPLYLDFLGSIDLDDDSRNFKRFYENAFYLCFEVKSSVDQIVDLLLGKVNVLDRLTVQVIISNIIDSGKKLETSVWSDFFEYLEGSYDDDLSNFDEVYLIELQIAVSFKLNVSSKHLYERLGESHLNHAVQLGTSFVAPQFYQKAYQAYSKAGNREKMEEMAVRIETSKNKVELATVSFEIKDEKVLAALKLLVIKDKIELNTVLALPADGIYDYMADGKIFPRAEVWEKSTELMPEIPFSNMAFDTNMNFKVNTQKKIINQYKQQFKDFSIPKLGKLCVEGVKSGKLTSDSFLKYLKENSWFGDKKVDPKSASYEKFDWIGLMTPSIEIFFEQVSANIEADNDRSSNTYILAIDSLTLKFEGLFRELNHRVGAQTIEINPDKTKQRISYENLLSNGKIAAIIPEDDLTFFKFLFTSEGWNIRNNVAHCFYPIEKYSEASMFLLLIALLRLGKINV
ncbi:DUF4209 domain-containing protein [Fluviicola taffensis]|uniref:DUF4209 domain-containing protein n=1 Tax=Fluviicola taffensis TaxID=191579 RepID=UPI003137F9F4